MLKRWLSSPGVLPRSLVDWLQLIGGLLALMGAFAAVGQYFVTRQEQRVMRTLEEARRFDEGSLAEAQAAVSTIAAQARRVFLSKTNNGSQRGFTEAQWKGLGDQVIIEASYGGDPSSGELSGGVRRVVGFYETLQVCIEREICDPATAHAYFDDYARAFWESFHGLIIHERRGPRPRFAKGMERFLANKELQQ